MKCSALCFLALACLISCHTPRYYAEKGNHHKAFEGYGERLRSQKKNKQNRKDLRGLESSFALAQRQDSAELALLQYPEKPEHWPRINALHRQILARQLTVQSLQPLRSPNGFLPLFSMVAPIDSLQDHSRRQAAAYLYTSAQKLLAITDSSGQRQPARDAYYALRDLKSNYYSYWENANALIDSAYRVGKAHVLVQTGLKKKGYDSDSFWDEIRFGPQFVKSDWLVFYTDSTQRNGFDYRAKCQLLSLEVGSESHSQTERTEEKQVEDGYDETLDSTGKVVSRTTRYKTETTTITKHHVQRSANGGVLLELFDEHTGYLLLSKQISASYSFDETSETSVPSAPTHSGMVQRVADDAEGSLRMHLKKALLPR